MTNKYIENIVVGFPIIDEKLMFAINENDWDYIEKEKTYYTIERYLPNILLELGVVPSKAEIRRNKPELLISLNNLDFMEIKWGKRKLYILVGFETEEERDNYFKNISDISL